MTQIRTKDNVLFEEPLSEVVTTRITLDEKLKLDAVAKKAYISISELLRNLMKENLYKYALSENLSKYLMITGQIDMILLETRLISSRKATNLSKMREILTDFESDLEESALKIDYNSISIKMKQIERLMEVIYQKDEWLASKIDGQCKRIMKHKHVKYLRKEGYR